MFIIWIEDELYEPKLSLRETQDNIESKYVSLQSANLTE